MKHLRERLNKFGHRNRMEKGEYNEGYFSRTIAGPPVSPRYMKSLIPTVFRNASLLLDAGCGTGECIDQIKESGKDAVGIDISVFAVRKSGQILASILRMPFKDNAFDGVTAFEVVEHLTYDEAICFLRECRRVLQRGGALVVSTPNWLPRLWLWLRGITDLTHKLYFNVVSIERILKICDFDNVQTTSETELKFGLRISVRGISPFAILGFGFIVTSEKMC